MTASAWYDSWNSLCPLSDHLSPRMITSAGFSLNDKVADIIVDNTWKWTSEWTDRFPNIQIPVLNTLDLDRLMRKDSNQNLLDFSVNVVWEDLRPQAAVVDWFPIVSFNQN
uniref:uncharacterized protein LOC122584451 n=1 Tax=Erigeron canadensis TaxID=72917 RepID=UPI001CB8E34C